MRRVVLLTFSWGRISWVPGDVYRRAPGRVNVDLILDLRFILLIAVLVDRSDPRVPHDKVVWSYTESCIHYGCLRKS